MSNLRLLILIDDSLSMNAIYSTRGDEMSHNDMTHRTMLDGSKEMVFHFISEIEQNPRLEILIQAQSVFIENDDVNKLKFSRDWAQHKNGTTQTKLNTVPHKLNTEFIIQSLRFGTNRNVGQIGLFRRVSQSKPTSDGQRRRTTWTSSLSHRWTNSLF